MKGIAHYTVNFPSTAPGRDKVRIIHLLDICNETLESLESRDSNNPLERLIEEQIIAAQVCIGNASGLIDKLIKQTQEQ